MSNDDQGTISPDATTRTTEEDLPGRRERNPLGYFSSFTHQISLYMITPDAYDAFIDTGRRDISVLNNVEGNQAAGAYLIAQSGGINDTNSNRAPGFDLDYYIDNLSIKTYMDPQATMTASNSTEVKFQIIEPYGFSFLTRLKNASDAVQEYSRSLAGPKNPTRQFFILGIKFLGYDENGQLLDGSKIYDGERLDPNSSVNGNGVFNRYYDINIINIKFNIDGTASTYHVDAISTAPLVAFGIKRGRINHDTTVVGETVFDVLQGEDGLITKLNKSSEENARGEKFNTYAVRWLGESAEKIKTASILSDQDRDKLKSPGVTARRVIEVTQRAEDTANYDPNKMQIIFKNDTAIQQAIGQIISQSTYLTKALEVVFASVRQPETDTGEYKATPEPEPTEKIAWYNLSAEVSDAEWDVTSVDFVYNITFVIQTYETPVINSVLAHATRKYYGPHKRYDYWYTGENSEILSYEQTINNGYFTIALREETLSSLGSSTDDTPVVPDRQINELRLGKLTVGQEAQNNYVTSLYDPASFASAKITILGDPDFLAMESPGSINEVYSRFYGSDKYTISPNGGQVFIEIDFKEAVDYDTEKGYLSINDRILFWQYPKDIPIQGVSYRVIDVMSSFQNGTFKQTLNCIINTIGGLSDKKDDDRNDRINITEPLNVNTSTWTVINPNPAARNETNADNLGAFSLLRPDSSDDDATQIRVGGGGGGSSGRPLSQADPN